MKYDFATNVIVTFDGDYERFAKIREASGFSPAQLATAVGFTDNSVIKSFESKKLTLDDRSYTLCLLIMEAHPIYILEHSGAGALIVPAPVGHKIKQKRKMAGLTQIEMADLLGLSGKTLISNYENSIKVPNLQNWTMFLLITCQHPSYQLSDAKSNKLSTDEDAAIEHTLSQMLMDFKVEDGYRHGEVELELSDDLDSPAQIQANVLHRVNGLTIDEATILHDKGLAMGVIEDPLFFPTLDKQNPNINWHDLIATIDPNCSDFHTIYFVELNDENELTFFNVGLDYKSEPAASRYIDIEPSHPLYLHLSAGYCAYMRVYRTTKQHECLTGAGWLSVPHYFLLTKWYKTLEAYYKNVDEWESLYRGINKALESQALLEQYYLLKQLKFSWQAGTIDAPMVMSALDVHIVLSQDATIDGELLCRGETLCQSINQDLATGAALEHRCYVDKDFSMVIQNKITCELCYARALNLINQPS